MKALLLLVQPTVIVPPLLVKVPPALITTLAASAVADTFTVAPLAIITLLLQAGTTPPTQVAAVFQLRSPPVTVEVIVLTEAIFEPSLTPMYKGEAVKLAKDKSVLTTKGCSVPIWCVPESAEFKFINLEDPSIAS